MHDVLIATFILLGLCAAAVHNAYWTTGYPRGHTGRVWSGVVALIAGSAALWILLLTEVTL